MKQCDLCNDRFTPPKDAGETSAENRYCRQCCADQYRVMLCRIHETIGISGYTIREINDLKSQKAALLAACKLTGDQVIEDMKTSIRAGGKIGLYFSLEELESIQSAIELAGESGG